MRKDYALKENMGAWLRHPVLGDPSFDCLERISTVYRSTPPREWAVNGSVYRTDDGTWYCYAGLYGSGYVGLPALSRTFRSKDKGQTWEDLGWTLGEDGFHFEGNAERSYSNPDVFLVWDEKIQKYILTYDGSSADFSWGIAHNILASQADSGAAIALGDSPEGPFTRLKSRFLSCRKSYGTTGRWDRVYASCVVPRKNDYIGFCLADSGEYFSWALTVVTATEPDGEWSHPKIILSCDCPGYYPCPMEFFPVELRGDKVLAHATSVARNRNYQVTFEADLESAHNPDAWKMIEDGNVFHAHDHPDEYAGMWGQTLHGFVEDGQYVVMYPSKTADDLGTINIASRPLNTPHTDGFSFTAHWAPSVTVLKGSWSDLLLETEFTAKGTVDIALGYDGILGPNDSRADSVPEERSLRNYPGIRIAGTVCSLISVEKDGAEKIWASADLGKAVTAIAAKVENGVVTLAANGVSVCEGVAVGVCAGTVALVTKENSRLACSKFVIDGAASAYLWKWNAVDAILGAGQLMPSGTRVTLSDDPEPNRWHRLNDGYLGSGDITAKWNLWGSSFKVLFEKHPSLGVASVYVDGHFCGTENLAGEGRGEYVLSGLENGPHAISVRPYRGKIAIVGCVASGEAF